MYESEAVSIDNIGDLPRVINVIGTLSIKGENTEETYSLSYCLCELKRREDPYPREYILSLSESQPKISHSTEFHTAIAADFDEFLQKDLKLRRLFYGDVSGYPSRSKAEMALMVKLVYYGFPQSEIW